MHFEILIEDQSGKKVLDILMPKIIEKKHTHKVISYRKEKSTWAEKIAPEMNVEQNASPSFCYFKDKIRELI